MTYLFDVECKQTRLTNTRLFLVSMLIGFTRCRLLSEKDIKINQVNIMKTTKFTMITSL